MAKIIVKGTSGSQVISDSDGKNSPLAPGAGQPVATASIAGKTTAVHGQVSNTSVVTNNPA